ncbi:MAG: GtrA family protein [Syntrophomonadaceae bacterium]
MREAYQKYRKILLYLIFGGLTTMVNIAAYFCLTRLVGVQYLAANAGAWLTAVLFAYASNRAYVFTSGGRGLVFMLKECLSFMGCRIFSGFIDTGIVFVMIDLLHFQDLVVKITANTAVVIINYFFSKWIVFRDKGQGEVIA